MYGKFIYLLDADMSSAFSVVARLNGDETAQPTPKAHARAQHPKTTERCSEAGNRPNASELPHSLLRLSVRPHVRVKPNFGG